MSEEANRPPKRNHKLWPILLVMAAIIIVTLAVKHVVTMARNHRVAPPQAVVIAKATTNNVPIYISALGSVIPTYTVTVKTQINGQLQQVLYKEGQDVKAGELIAQIDPRPYEAQLLQYQGQLTHDLAVLTNDRINLERYKKLWAQNSVAKQTLDNQAALVTQDEGTVKADEGEIQGIKLNLTYTHITSPINGRVGLRLVDPGNYVQTTDTTGLVVINTINPITVVFSISEDNVPEVLEQIHAGKTLTTEAYDREQNKLLDTGTLMTIDNQIDTTTGTVKLKAQFQNNTYRLFPNQFVNIKLLIKTLTNATLVPTAAIQRGIQGSFVFLVNSNNTVTAKTVTVGPSMGDNTVVTAGITHQQSVVVEGADKLADGSKISIKTDPVNLSLPTGHGL